MPFKRVRILHISDLHERGPREIEAWRRRRVLGDAWEENLSELLQDGPIDLVCFTGDASDWGRAEELAAATEFFEALLERLNLSVERLFVVPGNHDVDRSIELDTWQAVCTEVQRGEPLALARWLHNREVPQGFGYDWKRKVFARLKAYRRWVRHTLGREELLEGHYNGGPHSYRVRLELRGITTHVIGLDSAWLCGDDSDAGRLRITDEQVMAQLTDEGKTLEGLRLVLVHHPFDDLHPADRELVRARLGEHADLVLRGHLHSPEISCWIDPDRGLRQLAAGCLYEGHGADQYPNAFQVLTLEANDTEAAPIAEVRLRSFSPRGGHWYDDSSVYREASDGRLRFALEAQTPETTKDGVNPFDPFNVALPPRFVGRAMELRKLEASLTDRNGISIVGDWRIGKSSLLRAWERKARTLGRKVVFLSGQGPEGASIATMISKIIGHPAPESPDAAADVLAAWLRTHPKGLEPVILIDEMDGIVRRFKPRFFERLREMFDRLALTVATRSPIDVLYSERGTTSPFDNRLRVLHLGLLEPDAAEAIIALGLELKGDDRELMRRWAGCHPFHLQLIGHCLVQARRFGMSRLSALEDYQDNAFARLRDVWGRLEKRERDALRATAQGQATSLRSLRRRGLLDEEGRPFGEVLLTWLREEQ